MYSMEVVGGFGVCGFGWSCSVGSHPWHSVPRSSGCGVSCGAGGVGWSFSAGSSPCPSSRSAHVVWWSSVVCGLSTSSSDKVRGGTWL